MCDWSSSVGLEKLLSTLEAKSPSQSTPRLSTPRVSRPRIPPRTRTPTFSRPTLPITDCIPPPHTHLESTVQFLKPTCRALPAAWGLISRTLGLPEEPRDLAWGRSQAWRGSAAVPPASHLAAAPAGEGAAGAGALPPSPKSLSERFLPAGRAGWELTDSHCCARSDQTSLSPLSLFILFYLFISLLIPPNVV